MPDTRPVAALLTALLTALEFASRKHSLQRRKNREASPYVNHVIAVAHLLSDVGGIDDIDVLVAAVLHDTLEDTKTTAVELDERFGVAVRRLVEEVTDDKTLRKAERKRLQVEHASSLSRQAKAIKIADKIANIRDVIESPPVEWPLAQRTEYLDWTEQVAAACRGTNQALEDPYDDVLRGGRLKLGPPDIATDGKQ